MLMAKIILSIGITVICTYIGYFKANTYIDREKEIKKILVSLQFIRNKIEYTNLYLKDIFKEVSEAVYKDKENIFKNTIESNLSIRNGFKEATNFNQKLNFEDKNILNNLALSLGNVERDVQVSELDTAYVFLEERLEDAKINKIKNVKMYKTLGVVSGLTISIILI